MMQQAILQQAPAATDDQVSLATSASWEASLQTMDLVTAEDEDELPPPAYGSTLGEIRDDKQGMGTSANVTDDGRVNIRINQHNRRLSMILSPALRQQVRSGKETHPPPPPYIPASLGGKDGVPPPSLNVVIQVVGSRGDVQPFVALGKVLRDTYGHRVRLATHPTFKDFVQENGVEFFSIGSDPSRLMAFMVKNPGLMPGFRSLMSGDVGQRRRDVAEYIQGCWRSCYQAGDGEDGSENEAVPFVADCIIANPPSFAHIHCAEKLGIPLHIMFTMPYSPTQAFPHPLANVQSSNADPQLTNYMSYAMIEVLSWQALGDIINRFRKKCLGLDPVSLIWAPGMLHRLRVPHTYCWSPALIPKPEDWGSHITISGFYLLDSASNYTPTSELQDFLNAGPPPVYIGFGSIVLDDPDALTELIYEAIRKTGQRVLLSKGWGGMGRGNHVPDNIFMLDNVPHDWLFQHVSCVVHHGGAGTTAAGITAGRPTVVIPFFGDQPFWGAMVARAGAGPDPIPHKQLTADNLANAIEFCLRPESRVRAGELGEKIAAEQGSNTGAKSFHQFLEPDRLRCTLAPSRSAAWRIRRTKIKLSAFAACTLANAKLLDFHDLKLFRSQEYNTDEGPSDPISGFGAACFGTLSSMSMGIADLPSETYKTVRMPFAAGSRQKDNSSPKSLSKESELEFPGIVRRSSDLSIKSSSSSMSSTVKNKLRTRDVLNRTGPSLSRGLPRMLGETLRAPMELSVGITKGFQNLPKAWGDDTVRPQSKVIDMKSGMIAIGKDFGFGMYDGVTGLVTQPWKGAQKDGAAGFFKGVGKGIGGLATKPGAALFGIASHFMTGVHRETQKLFSGNVHNHIIASRVTQGYRDWLESSEKEKEDVIVRWKLIQKYLKKKISTRDEMVRDALDEQQKTNPSLARSRDAISLTSDSQSSGIVQQSEHINVERVPDESSSHSQQTGQEIEYKSAKKANMSHTMESSEAEAQRRASEESEYEEHLKRILAQSLVDQRQGDSDSELGSDMILQDEGPEELDHTATGGFVHPPLYDTTHLAGTTQREHEAQHLAAQGREKTAQEKTEEEIVMEYMKKQSLLEVQHQGKGKGRDTGYKDDEDEDLQEALKLSLQERGQNHAESLYE